MRIIQILVAVLFLPAVAFSQTTWYVDDDAPNNPGSGTPSDPFLKIQSAINVSCGGDTVLVLPGTYVERIVFSLE